MASKISLTFAIIGMILMGIPSIFSLIVVGNAILQQALIFMVCMGAAILAVGCLIGAGCVIKLIWED